MNLIDKLIKKTTVYENLKTERDNLVRECSAKEERIKYIKHVAEEKNKELGDYICENMKLTKEIEKLEKARRSAAGKVGGLKSKNNKLQKENNELKNNLVEKDKQLEDAERKIKFLKGNRRAPNLEELKDYELKRKRSVQKNSSK